MAFGASPAQVASHAEAVGRGDRPQGSTATPDGYTTVGPNTTLGYSSVNNEVNYQATVRDRELQKAKNQAKADFDKAPPSGPPDPDPVGPGAMSVAEMQSQDPAETGTQTDETSPTDQRGGGGADSGASATGGYGPGKSGPAEAPGPDASAGGGMDAPGSGVGGGTAGQSEGQEAEEYDGGLIVRPKKKKQKKMKRGGLASRK